MTSLRTDNRSSRKEYVVASWACGKQRADGLPAWEVLEKYIARPPAPRGAPGSSVKVLAN